MKDLLIEIPINDESYLVLEVKVGFNEVQLTRNIIYRNRNRTKTPLFPDTRKVSKMVERERIGRLLKSSALTKEDKFVFLEALYFAAD